MKSSFPIPKDDLIFALIEQVSKAIPTGGSERAVTREASFTSIGLGKHYNRHDQK